jgi:hypothetical protein
MNTINIVKPFIKENKKKLFIYTCSILLAYPLESVVIPNIFSSFFEAIKVNPSNETFYRYFGILVLFMLIVTGAQIINSLLDTKLERLKL